MKFLSCVLAAGSVLLLGSSPLAKGLYHRAICESGARVPNDPDLRRHELGGQEVVVAAGEDVFGAFVGESQQVGGTRGIGAQHAGEAQRSGVGGEPVAGTGITRRRNAGFPA